ncbi:hypothetical protein [Brassicibacter mesophilus]|uniref:hypothetical protein n=1 Tax=Brassicibacter mesophilus TaxID=745119 RepID=UPI003D204FFF
MRNNYNFYNYVMFMINKVRNTKGYVRGLPYSPDALGKRGYMNYRQLREVYRKVQADQRKMGY